MRKDFSTNHNAGTQGFYSVPGGVVSHRLGRVGEVLPPVAAVLFPVLFIPTLTDTYVLPRASLAVADGCLLAG